MGDPLGVSNHGPDLACPRLCFAITTGEGNIGESIDLDRKLDVATFRCGKATMKVHRNPEPVARIKGTFRRCPTSSFRCTEFPDRPIALAGNEARLEASASAPGER